MSQVRTTEGSDGVGKPRVVVTNGEVPQQAIDLLKTECDVVVCDELPAPCRADILRRLPGAHAVFWQSKERLDGAALDAAGPQLRVVSTMSAGYDNVDVSAARAQGVLLGHTPGVLAAAVAEIAVLLALAARRRVGEAQACMRQGRWAFSRPQWMLGRGLAGAVCGIVGLGSIGVATATRLRAFGPARLLYAGRTRREAAEAAVGGAEWTPLPELLAQADVVFATCPLTPETRHLFGREAFAAMKSDAVFVNVSRGEVVDQDALVEALRERRILGAGLDVTSPEPLPADHPLLTLDNCVLLPHIGSATVETRGEMALLAARNILAGLKGEPLLAPIP